MTRTRPQPGQHERCRAESVVLFTRQLAVMLRAGIPVAMALETLRGAAEDPPLARALESTSRSVCEGVMLSRALAHHPAIFSPFYLAMVSVGENTGGLDEALHRLAGWLEREHALKKRFLAALTYPAFVLGMTAALTVLIFYTALPQFVSIFKDMRLELPWMTRLLFGATGLLRNPGTWLVAAGLAVGAAGWLRFTLSSREGACRIYSFLLAVPLLGGLLRNVSLVRFSSAMETMLSCGIPLLLSLKSAARATGNPVLERDMERAAASVAEGESVAACFASQRRLYPATFANMLLAGEEASSLGPVFGRLSAFYDLEVTSAVEMLSASLEPLLMAGVALVVGFVVVALFLPMYSYLGSLGS